MLKLLHVFFCSELSYTSVWKNICKLSISFVFVLVKVSFLTLSVTHFLSCFHDKSSTLASKRERKKRNIRFAPTTCDSSIQVILPLEQIYSLLHDLHWTSIGFRAVIFRSLLCLVWMPVETLIQSIEHSFNMVLRILFYSTFSFLEALGQSLSCYFYEAKGICHKTTLRHWDHLTKGRDCCVCVHYLFIPFVRFIALKALGPFLLPYK